MSEMTTNKKNEIDELREKLEVSESVRKAVVARVVEVEEQLVVATKRVEEAEACEELANEQSAHRRTIKLADALVAALPKCTMPGCDDIATRAYERGRGRFCDGCGGLPHTREAPDSPFADLLRQLATPLRAWLKHREEMK